MPGTAREQAAITLNRGPTDLIDRGGGLYVGIFLLWPLGLAIAMLVGIPLAWLTGASPHLVFPVTVVIALAGLHGWQAWDRSAWRRRRQARRDPRFSRVAELGELSTVSAGRPVRIVGRVRAKATLPRTGDVEPVVYERLDARSWLGRRRRAHERGCDFELVAGDGTPVLVLLAGATVLPLRARRQPLEGLRGRVQVLRDGDEVEVTGCVRHQADRAALPRESALRSAIGPRGVIPVTVVAL